MSDLGLQLKQAREEKQLSLEDLQRTTKIQKRYLVAIEEGRFDSLPGLFYARAFVKTYAEAVGLDATELLEQHKNELPQPSKDAENIPSRSERRKPVSSPPQRKSRASSILPVVAVVVFIIIIAAGISLFRSQFLNSEDPADSEPDSPIEVELGETPEPEEEDPAPVEEGEEAGNDEESEEPEPEEEPTSELTLNDSTGNTSSFDLEASEFELTIEFSGDCSADIRNADGDFIVSSGLFSEGDEISEDYSDEESILINLGASQNATVFINGEEVDMPLDLVHQKLEITYNAE
ncbi:helix-turn-helix domain-containing protein [Alkalicoccobacillus murimartini]|uniref:Cytoskeletal protein RodZ n=1 Tax=Alkalicoccobacillus murimartini TaxID=171685 RepID=A0ABT9YGD5_9BACI|nr:helix-turn-helix domain-containing protein [Alkalicoccobacillus murimartini]MDQ0206277.1 cytoskeletal protein RodZ [Alkalicoccobacillus murimartini]